MSRPTDGWPQPRSLEQLVDLEGLDAGAVERLRGVHALLVEAGAPPELTPALADAPRDNVIPLVRRRPVLAGLAFAAAVAAAAFGGGFLLGHGASSGLHAVKVVGMQGEQNSLASIKIGRVDA